jgi:hypothetical protein
MMTKTELNAFLKERNIKLSVIFKKENLDNTDMIMLKKDLYNVPNIFHIALEAVTLYKQQEFEKLQGIIYTLKRIYNLTYATDDEIINQLIVIRQETMMGDGWIDYRVEKDLQVDVMIEMAKDSDKLESENFIAKVNNIPWPKPLDPPTTTAEAEARQRRFEDNIRYIQG